jgi:eukaryotic-like serine/threonine-protein kinase
LFPCACFSRSGFRNSTSEKFLPLSVTTSSVGLCDRARRPCRRHSSVYRPPRQLLQHGPIAQRKVIDYGVQIAHGLAAAHEKGIVHRDLKPENLFVTKDGRIKILDFGLAKLVHHQLQPDGNAPTMTQTMTPKTDPGMVMGTAGYMSPEQVRGATVDHRTDIFALGAILYEMLTGRRAF